MNHTVKVKEDGVTVPKNAAGLERGTLFHGRGPLSNNDGHIVVRTNDDTVLYLEEGAISMHGPDEWEVLKVYPRGTKIEITVGGADE